MLKLTQAEKDTMREHVLALVEHGLPPLVRMPVPNLVKSQQWYKDSNAEELVFIDALLCGKIELFNGKLQPALKACLMDEEAGKFHEDKIVIGASSGNWAAQMGLIAPMFSFKEFHAVIDRSVPKGKQAHLEASGAKIDFAPEGVATTDYVYELVKQDSHYHLIDQYIHEGSIIGHKWTMDHIAREVATGKPWAWLTGDLSFFGAVTGTCSTIMAAKRYLQPQFPKMKIWGVASQSKKEKVPGSRSPETLVELKRIGGFPYETVLDGDLITSVTRDEAYEVDAELVQKYLHTIGPTGALLLAGVWHRLREHWEQYGNFDTLTTSDGIVHGAIFVVDSHVPYLDDTEFRKFFQR